VSVVNHRDVVISIANHLIEKGAMFSLPLILSEKCHSDLKLLSDAYFYRFFGFVSPSERHF